MADRLLRAALLYFCALLACGATDIEGVIVIKHKLTRRKVTPAANAYERGAAVELASDPDSDPLAYELRHVAIYLEGQLPCNPETATLEQRNRRFSPELLVIAAGSTVSFPNYDPIFHNVFSFSKPKNFDLGNYPRGQTRRIVFPQPGIVLVNCHLHPNMTAAILVVPNNWHAQADAAGRFELHDVPAGQYTAVAWHKAAGFFRQQVTLAAAHDAHLEFEIPLDENGAPMAHALGHR